MSAIMRISNPNVQKKIEILSALNSPSYSPTLGILHTIIQNESTDWETLAPELLRLDRYPTQLSDAIADLCKVVLRRNQQLRLDNLFASNLAAETVDLVAEQARMRSEFETLSKGLWDRQQAPARDPSQDPEHFEAFIQPHLSRIEAAFPELQAASRRYSVDSELEAITLEGISDRYDSPKSPQVALTESSPMSSSFNDLPTETVWKIFRYLEPIYLTADLIAIQDYRKAVSMFAPFALVSKSWLELTAPSLYRSIALFNIPSRLDKLSQALKRHGSSVRVVIIDDIDIGPIHIRTCNYYIDKCLSLCPNLLHVQCNGDVELGSSRLHNLSSLSLILPSWLPVDLPAALRFAGPSLERLEISRWDMHADANSMVVPSTLPQLRKIILSEGAVNLQQATKLFVSATNKGENVLQELSIFDMAFMDGPGILGLLSVNGLCKHLTTLCVRLHSRVQFVTNNDFPLAILAICPSLLEFSYQSPSSVEVFTHLPPTLRALELGVLVPHVHCALATSAVPSVSWVEPFIQYLCGETSRNLRRLSIVRQVFQKGSVARQAWRRLDTQTWDPQHELRELCRMRNVQLHCSFSLHVS